LDGDSAACAVEGAEAIHLDNTAGTWFADDDGARACIANLLPDGEVAGEQPEANGDLIRVPTR
jgi:hypothetical protein